MATATSTLVRPRASGPPRGATSRDFLGEIRTAARPRPAAMVLYGPPGVGKTSFGAAIPNRVFLHDAQEDGINTLKNARLVDPDVPTLPPAESWTDVLGSLRALLEGEHDYQCLVVDTLGGMERLCHEHVCNRDFHGDWGERGFASYQKGYDVSLADWRQFLNALDELRVHRGMRVVLLGHSQVRPFKNPYGEDYDRYTPDVHAKTWNLTHKWADMVLFANYFVVVDKKNGRAKGRGGQERVLYTEHHAAYEAKNRFGLPAEISMGNTGQEAWNHLIEALLQQKQVNQESKQEKQ
jgi:hypothetical protein